MLCRRYGVPRRGVYDDDAAACRGLDIDIVNADSRSADNLKIATVFDDVGSDLRLAAHDQGIILLNLGREFLDG